MYFLSSGFTIYILVCAFIFGTVFGSAMNCLALRIVRHEKWGGKNRSKCPDCGHTLSALDLVPVFSWICLGGKCRYCKNKISPRYLIAELILGLCYVLLALRAVNGINGAYINASWNVFIPEMSGDTVFRLYSIQSIGDFLCGAILVSCLFALSLADLDSFEIPDRFILVPAVTRIVQVFLFGSRHYYFGYLPDHGLVYHVSLGDLNEWSAWKEILVNTGKPVLTGLIVGLVFIALSLFMDKILKKNSLGGGDIKLFAMAGLWLRPIVLLPMILLSCIIGLVPSLIAMKKAQNDEADEIPEGTENTASDGNTEDDGEDEIPAGAFPFGPAISAAAFICLLYGDILIEWYLKLTGIG